MPANVGGQEMAGAVRTEVLGAGIQGASEVLRPRAWLLSTGIEARSESADSGSVAGAPGSCCSGFDFLWKWAVTCSGHNGGGVLESEVRGL